MKIAGICSIWNDEVWAPYCLKQASEFCDVVFVVEGGHSTQFPERSEDGTRDIVKRFAEEAGNVHMLQLPFSRDENDVTSQRYDHYQCAVWNYLLQQVRKETDAHWVRAWDSDMYFFDEDLNRLRDFMECTQAPSLRFQERRFCYNFRYATEDVTGYFYRVADGSYFTPISKLHFADRQLYGDYAMVVPDVVCHHYSGVRTCKRMEQRFLLSAEKGTPGARENFRLWNTLTWESDDEAVDKIGDVEDRIIGGKDAKVYSGPHPEVLSDHPWMDVDDVRLV